MKKPDLKHFVLVNYTLKYLSQKEKVRVLRELCGYKEKKNGKAYNHAGIINKPEQKLGSNVLFIPISEFENIQNFFSRNNVKIRIKEAWIR